MSNWEVPESLKKYFTGEPSVQAIVARVVERYCIVGLVRGQWRTIGINERNRANLDAGIATIALFNMGFCMRVRCLLIFVFLGSFAAAAQDWQAYKPEGDYSFNDVKAAVHRVTSSRMYSGWDEKMFNRSGDLVAVAVLKTQDDSEMSSPESVKFVLLIVRMAFECPQYCVKVADDRRPRMTLLLLEHLNEITGGKMQTDIEEMKHFIQLASKANCQMEGIIYQNGVPIRVCTKG